MTRPIPMLFAGTALLLASTPAVAQSLEGRVGVGVDTGVTGGPNAHVTYWVSDTVGLQGSLEPGQVPGVDEIKNSKLGQGMGFIHR